MDNIRDRHKENVSPTSEIQNVTGGSKSPTGKKNLSISLPTPQHAGRIKPGSVRVRDDQPLTVEDLRQTLAEARQFMDRGPYLDYIADRMPLFFSFVYAELLGFLEPKHVNEYTKEQCEELHKEVKQFIDFVRAYKRYAPKDSENLSAKTSGIEHTDCLNALRELLKFTKTDKPG